MTTTTKPSAKTIERIATESGFKPCKHSEFGLVGIHKNGHLYKVKTVTTKFVGDEGEKRKNYFFACSISHVEQLIEQANDFMKKVYAGYYTAIKGNWQTAYYVEKLY